jgi:hypothetical protein
MRNVWLLRNLALNTSTATRRRFRGWKWHTQEQITGLVSLCGEPPPPGSFAAIYATSLQSRIENSEFLHSKQGAACFTFGWQ